MTRAVKAMEHTTDDAREKYLHEHPGADPAEHTIKKRPRMIGPDNSLFEPGAPFKKIDLNERAKLAMSRTPAAEFQHALTARSVVARFVGAMDEVAMEFDTPEAMEKYLQDHPGADKSNHRVKKHKDQEEDQEPDTRPMPDLPVGSKQTFRDDKTYDKCLKRSVKMEKDMSAVRRLGAQVDRLHSYRHSDPAKAKEVAAKLHERVLPVMKDAEQQIADAKDLMKRYTAHHGPGDVSDADNEWMGKAIKRAEEEMKDAQNSHDELKRGIDEAGGPEKKRSILDVQANSLTRNLDKVYGTVDHITAVMHSLAGQMPRYSEQKAKNKAEAEKTAGYRR